MNAECWPPLIWPTKLSSIPTRPKKYILGWILMGEKESDKDIFLMVRTICVLVPNAIKTWWLGLGSALTQGVVYSLYTSDEQGIMRLVTGDWSGQWEDGTRTVYSVRTGCRLYCSLDLQWRVLLRLEPVCCVTFASLFYDLSVWLLFCTHCHIISALLCVYKKLSNAVWSKGDCVR